MILLQIMESKWQDKGCLKLEKNRTWIELNFQTIRSSVQFVQPWLKRIFISVAIIPHQFWVSSKVSVSCALKLNYYLTFYWIQFLYEIWDYYNQALFYAIFPTSRHLFVCGSYSSIELQNIFQKGFWNLS